MMQNDLFRHGSGDPLSKGSPWKGIPHYSSFQSLNPAKTRAPQHQPYQSPSWRGGFSTDSRAPSPAHHHSSKALSGWSRSRKRTHNTHSPPRETPSDPGNPFYRSLTAAKTPQSPQTGCLTRPGNPLIYPSHSGNPHPHPRRWSPSRGFHPESARGVISNSQAASAPPRPRRRRRRRRRRREPPQLLPPPPPHPGSLADPPAPFSTQPLGQGDPRPGLEPNWKSAPVSFSPQARL